MDHPADCRSDLPPPSAVQIIRFQPYIIYMKQQASSLRTSSEPPFLPPTPALPHFGLCIG